MKNDKNLFSFRAECQTDVDRFYEAVKSIGVTIQVSPAKIAPDVLVSLMTDASLEEVRSILAAVPDGHVMAETIREVPLEENSLERERMRG
jgi:hypothetical protein